MCVLGLYILSQFRDQRTMSGLEKILVLFYGVHTPVTPGVLEMEGILYLYTYFWWSLYIYQADVAGLVKAPRWANIFKSNQDMLRLLL